MLQASVPRLQGKSAGRMAPDIGNAAVAAPERPTVASPALNIAADVSQLIGKPFGTLSACS